MTDPRAEAEYPANMSGVVRVRARGGVLEAFVVVPKGEPSNFMSAAELRAKFDALAAPYLGEAARDELTRRLLALHEERDVTALLALTRPDQSTARLQAAGD